MFCKAIIENKQVGCGKYIGKPQYIGHKIVNGKLFYIYEATCQHCGKVNRELWLKGVTPTYDYNLLPLQQQEIFVQRQSPRRTHTRKRART